MEFLMVQHLRIQREDSQPPLEWWILRWTQPIGQSVTPRIPNNVNHTCKSEYYNVYGMLHFVKYLNNRVKFSINKVNIN